MSVAVSTAKVEITPTLASNPYLGGYATDITPREAVSDSPHAPLYARCVILWDLGFPNVIVSADVLAFPRSMHQAIRERVLEVMPSQSSTSDFVLQATHTHNGPVLVEKLDPFISYNLNDLSLVTSYCASLEDQIVALVETALAAPQTDVDLDYRVASENFARNDEALSYTETAVPILTARDSTTDEPVAVIFSYGCHPTSAGRQTLYDGDWPAGACAYIEQQLPGCFALFLQGAAGDQVPSGDVGFGLRDQLSTDLGATVTGALSTVGRAVTGPIQTSYQEIALPLDVTDTPENLAAVRAAYVIRQGNIDSHPAYYQRHAQVMINQIDTHSFTTTVELPLQVWKLQGSPILRIALTGGELASGYAAYFRNLYGGPNGLLIGGYANEIPKLHPEQRAPASAQVGRLVRRRLGYRFSGHRRRLDDHLRLHRPLPSRDGRGPEHVDQRAQRDADLAGGNRRYEKGPAKTAAASPVRGDRRASPRFRAALFRRADDVTSIVGPSL